MPNVFSSIWGGSMFPLGINIFPGASSGPTLSLFPGTSPGPATRLQSHFCTTITSTASEFSSCLATILRNSLTHSDCSSRSTKGIRLFQLPVSTKQLPHILLLQPVSFRTLPPPSATNQRHTLPSTG